MKKIHFPDLIVFESKDYILINKPYDVATLDERDITRPNILRLAQEYWEDAQVCHRLDKETSGILALSKHTDAYRHLSLQFQKREVDKVYHAFVGGFHEFDNTEIDLPIAPSGKSNVRIDVQVGKKSITLVNTLKTFSDYTLVECRPLTGRMHQIRIHLATRRAAIIGDEVYGGKHLYLSRLKRKFNLKKDTEEKPLSQRVALHAYSLSFQDLEGKNIFVESEYPKDIRALLNQLEKHNRH